MRPVPPYFEAAKAGAATTWETLEASPELAGPWHRLFQQVQSPRHVLSELLQNADDADATWASASIVDGTFVFCHNGRDFSADEFSSICRFGYSNKRALHTIGFRGVGFKSAFSLGDEVRIVTPTLDVLFRKNRFTEPTWANESDAIGDQTQIRVELRDAGVRKQLASNLNEWLSSPASLLFFRSIRSLQIDDKELRWNEEGPGPVSGSQWLRLDGGEDKPVLLVRSEAEPFPEEALAEIEAERILGEGEHLTLPPCTVELLLGEEKRLFVVLPTGVKTDLPFALNAPFVQDTARLKVKDPDTSPTNKWLLQRAGRLAAETMLAWLNQREDDLARAAAYDLMPDVDREATSLEGSCAAVVEISFADSLEGRPFILTEDGNLAEDGKAVSLPAGILDVWSLPDTTRLFSPDGRQIASRLLSASSAAKLQSWQAVSAIGRDKVIERLKATNPKKPQTWSHLLRLWSYLSDDIPTHWYGTDIKGIRVAPVQGGSDLFSSNSVVRLGEKRLLTSDSDWTFLSNHLRVLNPNWGRFLAEQRKLSEHREDGQLGDQVERAYRLMAHLQLEDSSETSLVMKRVAASFFAQDSVSRADCVRLAHIAARLGANAGPEFKFVTQDSRLRPSSFGVVADEGGRVCDIVPESWADEHILHSGYWGEWTSCSREEWNDWVLSGRSGMSTAPPIKPLERTHWTRKDLDSDLKARGYDGRYEPHYKTQHFKVHDADFEFALWKHWNALSQESESVWTDVFDLILSQRPSFWEKSLSGRVQHIATTGTPRQIASEGISTSWILKFRDLPCLRDTRGVPRKPFEVLRRTPQTEALLEVEPFIAGDMDTEANRPLFEALRVRDTPSGPEQILERIQALAEAESPPLDELDKWYRKLDSLLPSCSTADATAIREAFDGQPLIFSAEHGWLKSGEVFLSTSEDDMPDAPVIRTSVRDLELWRRLDVADRPNFSLILSWLSELPDGTPLATDVAKRVKSALARFPDAVWSTSGHWLNLAGQWVETDELKYSLSLRSLTKSQDLFPAVRQATADFQMLSHEQQDRAPFSSIPSLASLIDERISEQTTQLFAPQEKPWLQALGKTIARIVIAADDERERVHTLGRRLASTIWRQGSGLQTIPYLDGAPVGPPRRIPAVWSKTALYVENGPPASLAGPVSRELARPFDSVAVADGIKFAFERDEAFIESYFAQEFKLAEPSLIDQKEEPHEEVEREEPAAEETPVGVDTHSVSEEVTREESNSTAERPAEEPSTPEPPREPGRPIDDRPRPPQRPTLIERFALIEGFSKNVDGIFKAADGRRLLRSENGAFPWEVRTSAGGLIQALLPQEHCLDREPITLDSDVWGLLQNPNSTYALLLLAPDSTPTVMTGEEVARQVSEGRITLFPAKYRLSKTR